MAGWRVGFLVGRADVVQALARLKSYLDYGTFQPIQIASIVAMNEAPDYPEEVNAVYRSRRDALCDGLARIGWEFPRPRATMFVWAPIPEAYRELGSLEFAVKLTKRGEGGGQPGHRLRPRRGGIRALRARRERGSDPPGGQGTTSGAAGLALTR